jgi:cell division protease FtsH
MDATVGQRTNAPRPQAFLPAIQDAVVSAAEATGREFDLAVRQLIEAGDACATQILEKRRVDLEAGVALLIAQESVTAENSLPCAPQALPAAGRRQPDAQLAWIR